VATHRILIVDDESTVARELETTLIACGFEVAAIASSGHEAIALAARTEPHLVLMDVELNGEMDGIEAAEEIRRHWPTPIIFMADEADEATVRRVRQIQPFGYIAKPFEERELQVNIDMALRNDEATAPTSDLEERFFTVSIDMLCCLDFTGYFKRLNPAWERALGFTTAELMSKPFIDFVHPDDRERTLNQNRTVRTGGHALSFENRYLCKDGSYRWLLWNAAPDSGRQVIYSVARDITERKRAEEERAELVGRLQKALAEVKKLREILPICSYCKQIRDEEDQWQSVESYISHHTGTKFSHSICPDCYEIKVVPLLNAIGEGADGEAGEGEAGEEE
jgi:PAS domain S-box-containing protein